MRRKGYAALFVTGLVTLFMVACSRQGKADMVLRGAEIHTLAPEGIPATAVAVVKGKIAFVGSDADVAEWIGPKTQVLDLRGATVVPGLIDAHMHLEGLGKALSEVRLDGTRSLDEVLGKVKESADTLPSGGWVTGRGWDQNDWPEQQYPTWRDLDDIDHPVYLRRVDGHAAWVNRQALELAGIDRNTADPDGGRILRDEDGEPTGILVDNAIQLVTRAMPKATRTQREGWVKRGMQECNRVGLTGVHDAGIDSEMLAIYKDLHANGEMTLRVYAMLEADETNRPYVRKLMKEGPIGHPGDYLVVRSMKLYADGALGSRGAAMLQPYDDAPGEYGHLLTPPDTIEELAREALDSGWQVCTHAIGDSGNRVVLNAYEKAMAGRPEVDHRFRVEHAQVIQPDDVPRFAVLKVIPSMQPTHATSDMPWAGDRIGGERLKGAYAWRSFLDYNLPLPLGSDSPVESPDPRLGLFAAITRMDTFDQPVGGWMAEQVMNSEEALRGFTLNAAWAEFAEHAKGSIEVGKVADFTIFNRDILKATPHEILQAEVLATVVDGKLVHVVEGLSVAH